LAKTEFHEINPWMPPVSFGLSEAGFVASDLASVAHAVSEAGGSPAGTVADIFSLFRFFSTL
jgi:hypothetical protein